MLTVYKRFCMEVRKVVYSDVILGKEYCCVLISPNHPAWRGHSKMTVTEKSKEFAFLKDPGQVTRLTLKFLLGIFFDHFFTVEQ